MNGIQFAVILVCWWASIYSLWKGFDKVIEILEQIRKKQND